MLSGLVAAPAPQSMAAEHQITDGTVTWGIKASWRNYIGSTGTLLDGGVTRNSDGTFDWPVASGSFDDISNSLRIDLAGSVHFRSHQAPDGSYILDSLFKDLYLTISPTEQTIRGTYSGNPREGGDRVETEDAVLATIDITSADFDVSGGATTWGSARTFGGPDNGLYKEGTPFDPVSIDYTGPGGIPELGDKFEDQGAPS
ncbi:HtaA domain-containing protein [Aeromicrobium sp. UC242_57]|uniref:HtaA domain-containing protein n=1 Tax=Aeromicrobium sp. UC242_57 TaxID=3374624 RepID=UPI0037A1CA4D